MSVVVDLRVAVMYVELYTAAVDLPGVCLLWIYCAVDLLIF